jgi:hypothetical protein
MRIACLAALACLLACAPQTVLPEPPADAGPVDAAPDVTPDAGTPDAEAGATDPWADITKKYFAGSTDGIVVRYQDRIVYEHWRRFSLRCNPGGAR